VGKISGGLIILKAFGFIVDEAENRLMLEKYDADLFSKGIDLLKAEL
jgi:hypothetical protein